MMKIGDDGHHCQPADRQAMIATPIHSMISLKYWDAGIALQPD
jgi:hypothetical protein